MKEANIRSARLRSQLKSSARRVERYMQNNLPSACSNTVDDIIPFDLSLLVAMARDGDKQASDTLWSFFDPWAQSISASLIGISEGAIDSMLNPEPERTQTRDDFWTAYGIAPATFSDALHSDLKSRRWDEHGTINFVDFVGMCFKRDALNELAKERRHEIDRSAWNRVRTILKRVAVDPDDWLTDEAIDAARRGIEGGEITGIAIDYFDFVSTVMRGVESLDKPLSDEEDSATLKDTLTHEVNEEDSTVNSIVIREALETLSERDADIVRRRVMTPDPEELKDIAAEYGITQQRAGQIVAESLEKLEKLLGDYGASAA